MNPLLTQSLLAQLDPNQVQLPLPEDADRPARILQFGTGVLLRGLVDYLVDAGNRSGDFDGRIVVVQSTGNSKAQQWQAQDGLFTIQMEGFRAGNSEKGAIIPGSVCRVLAARDEWDDLLAYARDPRMDIVVSNTTEIGLHFKAETIGDTCPDTYPAKLTALLYERFKHFEGAPDKGWLVLPTELIAGNGSLLKSVVFQHIKGQNWPEEFATWVTANVHFCDTLVDRIVPGKPGDEEHAELERQLGYTDPMMVKSELYALWAIEGKPEWADRLGFVKAGKGAVLTEDITPYRERKLRILNGSHTLSVAAGHLAGLETVREMMADDVMGPFVERVILDEIAVGLPVDPASAQAFGKEVIDRFRNPFLHHKLLDITLQYTSKMKARNVPNFQYFLDHAGTGAPLMAMGFAAFLHFARPVKEDLGKFYGEWNGQSYLLRDDQASYWWNLHQNFDVQDVDQRRDFLTTVLTDEERWGMNLLSLGNFGEMVTAAYEDILTIGVRESVSKRLKVSDLR
ncbi:tagaturonate reductase [Pontibacter sp. G13]|uniref:tagaturonate reductase n=1 Tax=Pontibacter sp. G13 TaxID=3074898 RepID=UPI00288ACC3E|nr:tagaturonate reductase [Pontibacter sp. G13]WNJ16640.1 tagaturonate reductase [Pontibacter sp. G13]